MDHVGVDDVIEEIATGKRFKVKTYFISRKAWLTDLENGSEKFVTFDELAGFKALELGDSWRVVF